MGLCSTLGTGRGHNRPGCTFGSSEARDGTRAQPLTSYPFPFLYEGPRHCARVFSFHRHATILAVRSDIPARPTSPTNRRQRMWPCFVRKQRRCCVQRKEPRAEPRRYANAPRRWINWLIDWSAAWAGRRMRRAWALLAHQQRRATNRTKYYLGLMRIRSVSRGIPRVPRSLSGVLARSLTCTLGDREPSAGPPVVSLGLDAYRDHEAP
jgi:hypothetical protein